MSVRIISGLMLMAGMAGSTPDPSTAESIPLQNASFEDGDLCKASGPPTAGGIASQPIPGWSRVWGGQMIQAGRGSGEDGGQILQMGDGAESQMCQRVGPPVPVQPDTTYTLSALAGAPPGQKWIEQGRTSKGKLRLVFTVLPGSFNDDDIEFWSDPVVCAGDKMKEYALSVSSSVHPKIVGKYITVFLVTEGSDKWDNYQVWDRVRLTATHNPRPEAR